MIVNKKENKNKFAVPSDNSGKIKECEKRDKYLDPAGEPRWLWNTRMMVMHTVIGMFRMVSKG